MLRKILFTSVLAALTTATAASAAQAPTLGPLTIIKAGQKTPIDVGGNHLHRGATIRKGTELRRWLVTMHGPSNASVALSCGPGAKHVGLGLQDRSKVYFGVSKGSDYYHRTIKVHFYPGADAAGKRVDADGAKGSVYALCKTS
jgi:hypothetical protein